MSDALWTRLAAPFSAHGVTWDVVSIDAAADEAVVAPRLRREGIAERLDQHCGVAGWSVTFTPFADAAVGCTIEIAGVRKSAVANALMGGAAATADAALAACAASFGLVVPMAGASQRVAFDAEAGVALHDPELVSDHVAGARSADVPPGPAPARERDAAAPVAAPVATLGTDAPIADAPVADVHAADVEARGLSRDGLAMIDRLVERLKDSGQGLQAARLLVRYGGYGKDAEAARALYGALRALLKSGDGVEVEA